ncbi:MAG TPA: hypothetical protein VN428_13540 [Bryobacteraceae bacterium]|nr:hypothetical protein [Bryobacteraceae bacterium]
MSSHPRDYLGVLAGTALGATLLVRTASNNVDGDLWHEMALAREIVTSGHVPWVDQFAYTPTLPVVVHHEWGAGVVAYLLAVSFGAPGILMLKYLLAAAAAVIAIMCGRRRGGSVAVWGWLALPAIWLLATGLMPVRAQAYTYVFVAVLLWRLQADEEGGRRWMLPWLAAFPLWANLHGGCAIGFVLIGGAWIERLIQRRPHRHLVAVAAGMAALLIVNPYGLAYYSYLWRALTMARPSISEWIPMWRDPTPVWIPFGLCAAVAVYGLVEALFRRREIPSGAAAVLLMAYAGATHVKMMPLFAIAVVCVVPGWLAKTPLGHRLANVTRQNWDLAAAAWLICVAVMGASVITRPASDWKLIVPSTAAPSDPTAKPYPVGAVEYLRSQRFTGNVLTAFEQGGYVMWKLYPAARVSMDGRYEVAYPDKTFDELTSFHSAGPRWKEVLTSYGTDVALIHRSDRVEKRMSSTDWRKVYSDPEYRIWARPGLSLPVTEDPGPIAAGILP